MITYVMRDFFAESCDTKDLTQQSVHIWKDLLTGRVLDSYL